MACGFEEAQMPGRQASQGGGLVFKVALLPFSSQPNPFCSDFSAVSVDHPPRLSNFLATTFALRILELFLPPE